MAGPPQDDARAKPPPDWTQTREGRPPTARPQVAALTPGTMVADRYRVVAALGRGATGEVYRADDLKLGHPVALKFIRGALSPERLERIYSEVRIGRQVAHPAVCRVYDLIEVAGQTFIAMEYVDGEDLASLLSRIGRLPVDKALEIGRNLCEGLAAMHEKGVVHRDLKPSNVMIDGRGRARITDFGLALDVPGGRDFAGTPAYMAPEQLAGDGATARSDLYGFGLILFEMLNGRGFFDARTMADLEEQHRAPKAPRVHGIAGPHGATAERVILHCLEEDPLARPESARELEPALAEQRPPSAPSPRPRRRAMAVLLALAAVGAVLWLPRARSRPLPANPQAQVTASVAVLPLANLSGDPQQEFFADGMTEALIGDLARIRSLRVISRTSMMQYKATRKPLREIADELAVAYVVEGAVLQAGGRVRITAKLIRADAEEHIWSESYERDLRDVLTLQGEVTRAIAEQVRIRLSPEEAALLARIRPIDPQAHDLYLRGRFLWNQRTPEALEQALVSFEQALAREPRYAEAYVGLADTEIFLSQYTDAQRPELRYRAARSAVDKALELAPDMAEAHASRGDIKIHFERDWDGAERDLRRALELNPGYATGRLWHSEILMARGFGDAAHQELDRGLEVDPFSHAINSQSCYYLFLEGRSAEADRQCRRAVQISPSFAMSYLRYGLAHSASGRCEDALADMRKAFELAPSDPRARPAEAYVLAVCGRAAEARERLGKIAAIARTRYVSAYWTAAVYAALGDLDQASSHVEAGRDGRDPDLFMLGADPRFAPLRDDVRFRGLVGGMGLRLIGRLRSSASGNVLGLAGGDDAEGQVDRPELDLVPVGQRRGPLDGLAAQARAVAAAEVLQRSRLARDHDSRVTTRDRRRVEPRDGARFAAEHVLPRQERDLAAAEDQPERGASRRGRRIPRPRGGRRAAEGISEAVDGAHELRRAALVVERLAQLAHEARQAGVRDMRLPPDALFELRARDRLRALQDQDLEEVEGLGRQMDGLTRGEQLAGPGVEHETIELQALRHARAAIVTRAALG